MSAQIMTLFGSLSSSNIDERVSAATSIVFHLTQADRVSTEEPVELDYPHSSDLSYTLKRLVRGLASPTPGARLGFSIALCEILNRFPQLSPQAIFDSIRSATPLQSGMKASEERDSLFGRLFGIKSIAQSGALFRTVQSSLKAREPNLVKEQSALLENMLDELDALVRRAPWLRESVGSIVISDLTMQILRHPKSPLSQAGALDLVVLKNLTDVKVWTLEQVSLIILLQQHSIELDWKSLLSNNFPDRNILSRKNHDKLFNLLVAGDISCQELPSESSRQSNKIQGTSALKIRPHFIHEIIIEASQSAIGFELSHFYNKVFEDFYFSENSSVSRKSHGFLILNILLKSEKIPSEDKPRFLTSNCIHILRVQLLSKDRLLHKMAQSVVSNLLSQVGQGNPNASALARAYACRIRALAPDFDQDIQHKLIRSLVSRMVAPELELWTEELIVAFVHDSPTWSCTQPEISKQECPSPYPPGKFRQVMLAQLCSIINMKSSACTAKCASSILRCLTLCAFFGQASLDQTAASIDAPKVTKSGLSLLDPSSNRAGSFPPDLRDLCKTRLYTCLLELIEHTRPHAPAQKTKLKPASAVDHLIGFKPSNITLEILHSRQQNLNSLTNSENGKSIKSIREILSKLRTRTIAVESGKLQGKKEALLLLWDILDLMTYDEQDEWLEALALIGKLEKDLSILMPSDSTLKSSQYVERSTSAATNLTECLLFLLSWPIALLRTVVEINFDLFSDCMGPESLSLLVNQLNPPPDLPEGHNSEDDSSEPEQEESHEVESSVDEDLQSDDQTTTTDGSVDEEFKNDVAMALGHALSKPTESDDDSGEESSLMDDDEMLALDDNLAAIFKRRSGKKLARAQSTQDLHLRMKILDLIAKFVKTHPAPSIRGLLIKPLLELISKVNPSDVVMKNKVFKILGDATRLNSIQSESNKPLTPLSAVDASNILNTVHLAAQTTEANDTAQLCTKCNLWLIELIQSNDSLAVDKDQPHGALQTAIEIHQQSLQKFSFKRTKLRSDFFSPIFKRFPSFGWLLRHNILDLAINPATLNEYRRLQMFESISSLIHSYPPKNQMEPRALEDFDDYLFKIKETIFSLSTTFVTEHKEEGLSKEQGMILKNLKELIKITNNALTKRLKINSSKTNKTEIWSNKDTLELMSFGKKIPASSLSGILPKLIEVLTKLANKRSIDASDQTEHKLKRKGTASNDNTTNEKSTTENQSLERKKKKKRK